MTDTFNYRQEMIETELTSFTKIIEKFPRYADFENGFLVNLW